MALFMTAIVSFDGKTYTLELKDTDSAEPVTIRNDIASEAVAVSLAKLLAEERPGVQSIRVITGKYAPCATCLGCGIRRLRTLLASHTFGSVPMEEEHEECQKVTGQSSPPSKSVSVESVLGSQD